MRFPWKLSILAISRTNLDFHNLKAVLALFLNAQSIQTHSDIELNFKVEIVLQYF